MKMCVSLLTNTLQELCLQNVLKTKKSESFYFDLKHTLILSIVEEMGCVDLAFQRLHPFGTLIARQSDEECAEKRQEACNILTKVHKILESNGCDISLDELLSQVNISVEEYTNNLKVAHRGKNVILKRNPSDVFTNGCNLEILKLWGGNIDFQFVIDEYTTVMYICGYMMKSEKALGEQLKQVARECQSDDIAKQLKKIGSAFLGHRVIGAPESVMKLDSMWLIRKSRKITFVTSNYKEQRVSIPKSKEKLKNVEDDDEDIFMTSIHDRYAARPNELNNLCLAKFAVAYDVQYSKSCSGEKSDHHNILDDNGNSDLSDEDDSNQEDSRKDKQKQEIIKLKHGLGFMRKRKRESILRTHKVKLATDPEKYYHSLLMLYFPWQSEESLKGEFQTYEEHYLSVKNIVDANAEHFNQNSDHIDNALDALAENAPPPKHHGIQLHQQFKRITGPLNLLGFISVR